MTLATAAILAFVVLAGVMATIGIVGGVIQCFRLVRVIWSTRDPVSPKE